MTLRHKVSLGVGVHFAPGWDCHGLPIELGAAKELAEAQAKKSKAEGSVADAAKVKPSSLDPLQLRTEARQYATRFIAKQRNAFASWGLLADWSDKGTYRYQIWNRIWMDELFGRKNNNNLHFFHRLIT